ncbi:MAG: FHA domain-containing protein [Micrococcales bacterium]|nr:FHA domain-containing protein [Micrococcales bacterium]
MTTVSSYVPGDWTAVVNDGFVALLGPATSPATAERLWFGSQERMNFIDGLSLLAAEGFGAMKPFVLSVRGDDGVTHVAVRGDVVVDAQLDNDSATVTIDGHGVATWTERSLGGVSAMIIRVPGALDGPDLPLVAGVVRAGGLRSPHGAKVGTEESADTEEPAPAADTQTRDDLSAQTAAKNDTKIDTRQDAAPTAAVVEDNETILVSVGIPELPELLDSGELELIEVPEPVRVGAAGADSLTIMSSNLPDVRGAMPTWSDEDGDEGEGLEPTAQLVLSTGLVVSLDRPVLLGRAPQAARVSSREMPRLVAVPSPQQDISRTHAEVRMEGDDVLVTDLDSTNGVHVLRPGGGARRLRPGEPRVLADDETVDLGDGVTFVVERMR